MGIDIEKKVEDGQVKKGPGYTRQSDLMPVLYSTCT